MNLDEQALRVRFNEQFSNADEQTVTINKVNSRPNVNKVWWSFRVERGTSKQVSKGSKPEWLQLGNVYVEFHIPRALGGSAADEKVAICEGLFRGWRSPDFALTVDDVTIMLTEKPDKFIKTALIRWRSRRIG